MWARVTQPKRKAVLTWILMTVPASLTTDLKNSVGDFSLEAQGLRLHTSSAWGTGSTPGWGRARMPCGAPPK